MTMFLAFNDVGLSLAKETQIVAMNTEKKFFFLSRFKSVNFKLTSR